MAKSTVVVYGGSGALGSTIIQEFKTLSPSVACISIDLRPNENASKNVLITELSDWSKQHVQVVEGIQQAVGDTKVDAIFCVAGGWAGGNASNEAYIKNCDLMWKQSVWSSSIAGSLASKFLKNGGLLTLTGASPCLNGTSFMMGYGMAKAAVHQLCKSLAQNDSGLPEGACTLCILPVTLDTPMNRKFMSDADFSSWTTMPYIAKLFNTWLTNRSARPKSGSLIQLITKGGDTTLNEV